jgi:hypothetical protein
MQKQEKIRKGDIYITTCHQTVAHSQTSKTILLLSFYLILLKLT